MNIERLPYGVKKWVHWLQEDGIRDTLRWVAYRHIVPQERRNMLIMVSLPQARVETRNALRRKWQRCVWTLRRHR